MWHGSGSTPERRNFLAISAFGMEYIISDDQQNGFLSLCQYSPGSPIAYFKSFGETHFPEKLCVKEIFHKIGIQSKLVIHQLFLSDSR
jgi:hypothetical protein